LSRDKSDPNDVNAIDCGVEDQAVCRSFCIPPCHISRIPIARARIYQSSLLTLCVVASYRFHMLDTSLKLELRTRPANSELDAYFSDLERRSFEKLQVAFKAHEVERE
jgi:hypothetical protein